MTKTGSYGWRIGILILALSLILSIRISRESVLLQEWENAGHLLLFGVAAVLALRNAQDGLASYFSAWLMATGLGIGTEALQWVLGGDAEWMDVARDALGAAAFLMIAWTSRFKAPPPKRLLVRLAAGTILVWGFLSPALTAAALAHRWTRFPVLEDFESKIGLRFCRATNAQFEVLSGAHGHVCRIHFLPSDYAGFFISGPFPDWTGRRFLVFTVASTQPETVLLNIRIHDSKHNEEYRDRFNSAIAIHPGVAQIRIPLSQIESAPKTRRLKMNRIQSIGLYWTRPAKKYSLMVDDFHLE